MARWDVLGTVMHCASESVESSRRFALSNVQGLTCASSMPPPGSQDGHFTNNGVLLDRAHSLGHRAAF
jgi:hypothetical protein